MINTTYSIITSFITSAKRGFMEYLGRRTIPQLTLKCPGKAGKAECPTCTDRWLKVTGHHADAWHEEAGSSLQVIYVTPPCQLRNHILRHETQMKIGEKSACRMTRTNTLVQIEMRL